jgi:hypothetical protein
MVLKGMRQNKNYALIFIRALVWEVAFRVKYSPKPASHSKKVFFDPNSFATPKKDFFLTGWFSESSPNSDLKISGFFIKTAMLLLAMLKKKTKILNVPVK